MAIELVTVVNPNGRKGLVAATSTAAAAYKRPPSTDAPLVSDPAVVDDLPSRGASTEVWQQFAATHGLTSDEATGKSRDDLVAFFYES